MPKIGPQSLLIVKNRAMGDAVLGLATIQYLKKILPQTRLIYAVPAWVAPLFSEVQTAADQIYPLSLKNGVDWLRHYLKIHQLGPEAIFEMFQTGRTQKFFRLFPRPYFYHNHHFSTGPVYEQGIIKPNIQRDLDGAWSYFGKKRDSPLPSHLDFPPRMEYPTKKEDVITLGVVATRETKMWPLKHYARLCQLICKDYPQTQIQIPLSTSKCDREIKHSLRSFQLPSQVQFVEAPLQKLPQILARSRAYIGNDTGLKHISAALGIKTWTLFGPEPPLEWHPYDTSQHSYFYKEGLECRTQQAHYCPLATCSSMECLKNFSPETVWESIKKGPPRLS